MKKKIIIIVTIIILVICLIPKNEELRIRIKANDDETSQQIKQEVVKEVKKYLSALELENPVNEIPLYIDDIKKIVDEVSPKTNNTVSIVQENFPTKTLNNKIISGGTYKTLLIKLDQGNGKNWWSMLYPEFYGVSFEDIQSGEVEYQSYIYNFLKEIFSW